VPGAAVEVLLSAPVYPTESAERVAAAVRALFPEAVLAEEGARVSGRLDDVDALARLVQRLRIPDTARGQLFKGRRGERTVVFLNKQAASAGRLNFAAVPGPLGDVRVEIVASSPEALERFILEVAPDTRAPEYRDPGGSDPDAMRPGSPYSPHPPPAPRAGSEEE